MNSRVRDATVCLYIVGGAVHDPERCHLPRPEELPRLFALFQQCHYALTIVLADPLHPTTHDEQIFHHPEYSTRIDETVHIVSQTCAEYLQQHPIQASRYIMVDFSGTWTPDEVVTTHSLSSGAAHILLPLSCGAPSCEYVPLLSPLVQLDGEMRDLVWFAFGSVQHLKPVNALFAKMTEHAARFAPVLDFMVFDDADVNTYMDNYGVIAAEISHCMSACDDGGRGGREALLRRVRKEVNAFYTRTVGPQFQRARSQYQAYFGRVDREQSAQASNFKSILAGMHEYGEMKPWYVQACPSLAVANLPVHVYLLALVHYAEETQLFGKLSFEEILRTIVLRLPTASVSSTTVGQK